MKPTGAFASILLAATLIAATPAAAQTASGQPYVDPEHAKSLITDPADKARYTTLAEELRCLVCQNQTLAESDASLAVDLRRQLETMVIEGRSDDEIKDYLVERYGDFVLYRPPVQRNTWLLWFGPFALLAIGVGVWFFVRRGRGAPGAEPASSFSLTRRPGVPVAAGSAFDMAARTATPKGPGASTGDPGGNSGDAAIGDADLERARRLLDGD